MPYYSKEEIKKAKELDLLNYLLNFEPDELVKENKNTYCTKSHDSLKISNGMWYWFSRGIGGKSAIDYLMIVKEYKFTEAIEKILGYSNNIKVNYPIKENKINEKLVLPSKNKNNNTIIKYLKKRGIDFELIMELINKDLIYEDDKHNIVFVGYDNNIPKYAFIRGCNNTRYMKDAYGSNKEYSFKMINNIDNKAIHIFESAIDLISYVSFLKINKVDWKLHNYLSLGGVYPNSKNGINNIPVALKNLIDDNKNINKIILHLDNDQVGRSATKSLIEILKDHEVIDSPPRFGKDVNDFLLYEINRRRNKDYEL